MISDYPDLQKRLDYELRRLRPGCGDCGRSRIIQRYAQLARERDVQRNELAKRRPGR